MKEKKPGDHVILRLKNNESPLVIEWMNHQSNLSDAIRYLIEEEIKAHEIRDLQEYIPAKRKPLQKNLKKHTVEANSRVAEIAAPEEERETSSDAEVAAAEAVAARRPEPVEPVGVEAEAAAEQPERAARGEDVPEARGGDEVVPERDEPAERESEHEAWPERELGRRESEAELEHEPEPEPESKPKSEPELGSAPEEDEEDFSDELVDHWMNI